MLQKPGLYCMTPNSDILNNGATLATAERHRGQTGRIRPTIVISEWLNTLWIIVLMRSCCCFPLTKSDALPDLLNWYPIMILFYRTMWGNCICYQSAAVTSPLCLAWISLLLKIWCNIIRWQCVKNGDGVYFSIPRRPPARLHGCPQWNAPLRCYCDALWTFA